MKGQETTDSYEKFDHELCGNVIPNEVVSDGPRLVMVFSSGELQGKGFKAKYTFETGHLIISIVVKFITSNSQNIKNIFLVLLYA